MVRQTKQALQWFPTVHLFRSIQIPGVLSLISMGVSGTSYSTIFSTTAISQALQQIEDCKQAGGPSVSIEFLVCDPEGSLRQGCASLPPFSFERGSSLALFLRSSFCVHHITSSALSDKHRARWPSMSNWDSLQIEKPSQIRIATVLHSCPEQSLKRSSSWMGKSFLCSEASLLSTSKNASLECFLEYDTNLTEKLFILMYLKILILHILVRFTRELRLSFLQQFMIIRLHYFKTELEIILTF